MAPKPVAGAAAAGDATALVLVKIKTHHGSQTSFEVPAESTVGGLIALMASEEGIPAEAYVLTVGGNVLDGAATIRASGITDATEVTAVFRHACRPFAAEMLDGLFDPLSHQLMTDPVKLSDGVTYERSVIAQYVQEQTAAGAKPILSPMTGQPLASTALTPDAEAKGRVQRALQDARISAAPAHEDRLSSTIFEALDKVMSMELVQELKVRDAIIIVFGMENCGKSTTAERLIRFPVLPRARERKICTTIAIRVRLRRGPSRLCVVSLVKRSDGSVVAGSERKVALDQLCTTVEASMQAAMVAVGAGKVFIDDHELRVEIQQPYAPNLEVLDLPGFVAARTSAQAAIGQDPQETSYALARSYVAAEKENAIFLLVCDGAMPANQSVGSRLVQETGIAAQTLGVYTRADRLPSDEDGTEAMREKLRGEDVPLGHGWVVVSSKLESATLQVRESTRLAVMDQNEKRFFSSTFAGLPAERTGMPAARKLVQVVFEKFIAERWVAKLRETLVDQFRQSWWNHNSLGVPVPYDASYEKPRGQLEEFLTKGALKSYVADLDVTQLRLQSDEQFKATLIARARTVSTAKEDWLGHAADAALWGEVKALEAEVAANTQAWDAAAAAPGTQSTIGEAMAARAAAVDSLAGRLLAIVQKLRNRRLAEAFVKTLIGKAPAPPKKPEPTLFTRFKTFLVGGAAAPLANLSNQDQVEMLRFDRFKSLEADLTGHLTVTLGRAADEKFMPRWTRERALEVAESLVAVRRCANVANGAVQYVGGAEAVNRTVDLIIQQWHADVKLQLPELVATFVITAGSKAESCRERRAQLLFEMVRVAEVLERLRQLEESVRAGAK